MKKTICVTDFRDKSSVCLKGNRNHTSAVLSPGCISLNHLGRENTVLSRSDQHNPCIMLSMT